MTLELGRRSSSMRSEALSQEVLQGLVEQLRYAQAVWDMLEAGTWSAAAGAKLDALLADITADIGMFRCALLLRTLLMARRGLRRWVRRDQMPDAAAAASLRTQLAEALAIGRSLFPAPGVAVHCSGCPRASRLRQREVS